MMPRTSSSLRPAPWQHELARAIKDPAELLRALDLNLDLLPAAQSAARLFGLRVPHAYVARMRKGDAHDPLLLQVLPLGAERVDVLGFNADPVGDLDAMKTPGLLHKYHGRVLLVTTGACAIHCRYCFRRHFPYAEANPAAEHWQSALEYIRRDTSIEEVILSGGDPLTQSDARLRELVTALEAIPHVRRLRIHTRLPVVLPNRVDSVLLEWMAATRLAVVVVIHANHANELDDATGRALRDLRSAGATLLNQAVLLRGINDSVPAQEALSSRLADQGVMPYYLHLLDRVAGAAHFDVSEVDARRIVQSLQEHLPGYLVPRLVREVPGAPSKTPAL